MSVLRRHDTYNYTSSLRANHSPNHEKNMFFIERMNESSNFLKYSDMIVIRIHVYESKLYYNFDFIKYLQ